MLRTAFLLLLSYSKMHYSKIEFKTSVLGDELCLNI